MGRKRKYPEVKGYWVYTIKVMSIGKYYVGVSGCKKCYKRWDKSAYKSGSLCKYLDEWDNMEKTVIQDNLSREEAYKYEGNLIQELSKKGLCINERRSGLITNDKNAYARDLRKNNIEYHERCKQRNKQRYQNDAEYLKERQRQYYEKNKEFLREQKRQYYDNNKEKINEKRRQRYQKKKLEKQQNQLTLFDLAS